MYKTLSAKYFQENKERLQKRACKIYQKLSKGEKDKKDKDSHMSWTLQNLS